MNVNKGLTQIAVLTLKSLTDGTLTARPSLTAHNVSWSHEVTSEEPNGSSRVMTALESIFKKIFCKNKPFYLLVLFLWGNDQLKLAGGQRKPHLFTFQLITHDFLISRSAAHMDRVSLTMKIKKHTFTISSSAYAVDQYNVMGRNIYLFITPVDCRIDPDQVS